MSETERLLHDIDQFLAKHEMADSTFGRRAVNDGKLLKRLREGRSVTLDTATVIRRFMSEQPKASAPELERAAS